MKRRFFALRLISGIYKVLAILTLVAMIGLVIYTLVDTTAFPELDDKGPVVAAAVLVGIVAPLVLYALAQLFDVLIAIEFNTRAATALAQKQYKLMEERL